MEIRMKQLFLFIIVVMTLTACNKPQTNMPNPASVYCKQNGNKLEIHTAADGSQSGVCIFPNGSSCDEWTYYRGECGPAQATAEGSGGGPGGTGGTEENGSGGNMPSGATEDFSDWWGLIKSTEPGAQYDDYFERQDLGQIIYFGIDSMDPAVKSRIEALRDSGTVVHLYGTLFSNVPDYNGSQVQVDRIETE
jgi:putative hemolysin